MKDRCCHQAVLGEEMSRANRMISSTKSAFLSMIPVNLIGFVVTFAILISSSQSSVHLPYVTCGSVVRLVNSNYMSKLHSDDIKYGSGSGQQSVTGTDDEVDANSYWQVKGSSDSICNRGEAISCGSTIRLGHLATSKNLHSHLFPSPLTGNQEVSAFGENGEGDTGDNWVVACNSEYWERGVNFRLKHQDTEKWLSISGRTYGRPISGQMEVIGSKYQDASSFWKTTEGVYVKPDEIKINDSSIKDEL
jgi:dolichyl-phosphate-mannose--protein O-mannosyl transferase